MKTATFISHLSVAASIAIIAWVAGPLWALIVGLPLAAGAALYDIRLVESDFDRIAARIRAFGNLDGARPKDDERIATAIVAALKEANDIYERVGTKLAADKQADELILDNMRDGVLLTDSSTKVIMANPAAGRIFRLSPGKMVGRPLIHSIHSQDLAGLIKRVVDDGKEVEAEIDTFMPRERRLKVVALPIDSGGGSSVLTVFNDITARHRIEEVRRDFVANVSHELKTPAAGISLLSDSLATSVGKDAAAAERFTIKLKLEARRLSQLVNDLLDLSQLEAEKLRPISTQISITDIAKKVVGDLTETAAAGGISLQTDLNQGLPKTTGSEGQLELMIRNLVDNAINYTPTGGIVLVTTAHGQDQVSLSVKDSGIGIPQDDKKRVFERFFRVDKDRSRETGGTGLGLSIVKHVVDNHGGKIKLESTVGVGSKFTILLPIEERLQA